MADLMIMEARSLMEAGNSQEALQIINKALKYFPEQIQLYKTIARINLNNGRKYINNAVKAYKKIETLDESQTLDKSELTWKLTDLMVILDPPNLNEKQLARFAGSYGSRKITFKKGKLYYSREGRPEVAMEALSVNTFALKGVNSFRIRFNTDGEGQVTGILGMYRNGNRDENPKE